MIHKNDGNMMVIFISYGYWWWFFYWFHHDFSGHGTASNPRWQVRWRLVGPQCGFEARPRRQTSRDGGRFILDSEWIWKTPGYTIMIHHDSSLNSSFLENYDEFFSPWKLDNDETVEYLCLWGKRLLNSGFGKSSGIDLDTAKICASHGMR